MATATTATAVGERETLADIIYKIDSDETPIFTAANKETSNGIFTEWQVQELSSAGQNSVSEGADMSDTGVTATVRMGNYHQISQKGYLISKTLDSVSKAGRDTEVAYQKVLKGLELRRDIEKIVGDLNVAKSASEPRKSATLVTWMTNGDASPSDISFGTGDGSDVADLTGTEAALTLAKIDNAMTQAWQDGGNPRMLVCDATNRANISDLAQAGTNMVTNQVNATASKLPQFTGAVSVYMTDFGTLDITPSRFMSDDKLFLIDPDYVCISTLNGRNFAENEIAATGDAEKRQIICEWSLKVKAPKAHAAVIGLSGA
jgi:hypothetical protein